MGLYQMSRMMADGPDVIRELLALGIERDMWEALGHARFLAMAGHPEGPALVAECEAAIGDAAQSRREHAQNVANRAV